MNPSPPSGPASLLLPFVAINDHAPRNGNHQPNMNTEFEPPSPPEVPSPPQTPATSPMDFVPMERPATFPNVIEALLKQPGRVLYECKSGGSGIPARLLLGAILCLAVFGVLLGTFSGGTQLWAAPAKVIGGVLFSMLICLPSLYVFSALGGIDARISQVAGFLLAAVALTSLLLLGFSPVIWIFSQSTSSTVFMGILAIAFWVISLLFGFRLLLGAAERLGLDTSKYLHVWLGMFFIVTLQMSTALRPIIGTADTLLPDKKKFFLEHWFEEMGGPARDLTDPGR